MIDRSKPGHAPASSSVGSDAPSPATLGYMPGSKPYTDAEWRQLQGLIGGACRAQELFDVDDLEEHTDAARR